ncbi:Vacuolar-sorting protein SNF8 [Fasciolopsis buskii]|uniref:Vacuolar-sorting protein SNF8 n=1 Tax=Fasciolopsis buskii TaxID=27845 RepID=A0A8E0VJR3_9TREM|nr:Vacuolar-sorting protein SNF8 [Fasciolopsis buski]
MRRGAGIGAIKNYNLAQAKYKEKGEELAETQLVNLSRQLDQLRQSLEAFAAKHGSKIKHDPQFRCQFQAMCASIGVDPISYSRGCWSETLGLGEFYYHLGVRIIEVCMANEKRTGGIMPLDDLVTQLNRTKSAYTSEIGQDDVHRSIKKLRCLGTGFVLIRLAGGRSLVQSVPGEMSMDKTNVLGLAEAGSGRTTLAECSQNLNWNEDRTEAALNHLVQDGMAWVDDSDPCGERSYWFPSLFPICNKS